MKVVATTHYGSLKALAHTMPGFANASVEFDVMTLSPTYRLFMGVPGWSSALEIAGRLGMDRALLDEARQKLHKDERVMETMLHDLQATQRQLTTIWPEQSRPDEKQNRQNNERKPNSLTWKRRNVKRRRASNENSVNSSAVRARKCKRRSMPSRANRN